MADKLTLKQIKFVESYLVSGNSHTAAIDAGYSSDSAKSIGAENLSKPVLKAYIEQRERDIALKATLTVESVLRTIIEIKDNPLAKDQNRLNACKMLGDYLKIFELPKELKKEVSTEDLANGIAAVLAKIPTFKTTDTPEEPKT